MNGWRDPADDDQQLVDRYARISEDELKEDVATEWSMFRREFIAFALVVLVVVVRQLWFI